MARLSNSKINFLCRPKRKNFIPNTLIDFEPVWRFKNKSGVSELGPWGFKNSTSKSVQDLLKPV